MHEHAPAPAPDETPCAEELALAGTDLPVRENALSVWHAARLSFGRNTVTVQAQGTKRAVVEVLTDHKKESVAVFEVTAAGWRDLTKSMRHGGELQMMKNLLARPLVGRKY